MRFSGHISLLCAMLLAAGSATAQAREGDWVSYRDAYRAMVVFEKYGKPKQFLQSTYQVIPKDKTAPTEGLKLTLNGKSTQLNLPLDAAGRTVFPLLKAAYDENAELTLNHNVAQYQFRQRISIVTRADGVYEAADLRAACEQALAYERYVHPSIVSGKKCAGVRFVYPRKGIDPTVHVRVGERDSTLPVNEGSAFADNDGGSTFRVVAYRFADWPATGRVVTEDGPLLISAVFE
ncbi:hypothetical protein E4L96_18685 [Massilia arenosa]|uniref:DUF2987 domain-containing protein n=1 Tax=Zemynaea arenosa TaxID=2561931 RepID=A0A4Y9S0L1_9BURK|nr:hypothetical protein [Massilia arenosa]TFW14864.1 hypothetical protein E4L96_18685 [Massilia arenosa]